jgi:hypothetical protein
MVDGSHEVPAHVLQAVADQAGRLALVVGAGCSLEAPTNLQLSDAYARKVHEELLLEHVLDEGDCANPDDLSAVASAVWSKVGSQDPVVARLPRGEFRDAPANDGYLVAAALLREGSVSAILTLNFDLAMTDALGSVGAGQEVSVIASPKALGELGSRVVIYLHRNANEDDFDEWILRAESLTDEWKGRWEEVLSQRVLSSPVVVFAGLGSPAAVLSESVRWIRGRIDLDNHHPYVVDPAATTPFQAALELPEDAHIRMGWCGFMACLDDRLTAHLRMALEGTCRELCHSNQWHDEAEFITTLAATFYARGLVSSGKQRARWTLHKKSYVPDGEQIRGFVAYLLLGIGIAQRHTDTELTYRHDGVVEFRRLGRIAGSCLAVSGEGIHHWTAMEPRIRDALARLEAHEVPSAVLLGSMPGTLPADVTPPENILFDEPQDDIVNGPTTPVYLSVDDLRSDPTMAERMVA